MLTVPFLWLVWLYLPRMPNVESVDSWRYFYKKYFYKRWQCWQLTVFFYKKYFYKRWQCWQLIVFFTKVPTHIFFVFYANFKADLAIFLRPNFFFKSSCRKETNTLQTPQHKREKKETSSDWRGVKRDLEQSFCGACCCVCVLLLLLL